MGNPPINIIESSQLFLVFETFNGLMVKLPYHELYLESICVNMFFEKLDSHQIFPHCVEE